MLKLVIKSKIFPWFPSISLYQGKIVTPQLRNPEDPVLTKCSRLSSPVMRDHAPLIWYPRKGTASPLWFFLLEMYNSNFSLNHERTSDKPKLSNIAQDNCLVLFKSAKVIKNKGRLRSCPDRRRLSKDTWQQKAVWDPGRENMLEKRRNFCEVSRLVNRIGPTWIPWIW